MTFSVVAVLRQSVRRLATGPALLVLLALAVVQLVATFVPGRIVRIPALVAAGTGVPPVVFTGNLLPLIALVIGAILTLYLSLVTIRVFAGQWGIVEREHLTQNVGFGLVNLIGLAVVLSVVLAVGLVILVRLLGLIGLFLWFVLFLVLAAVAFFAPAFVAVENDNLLTAFQKSVSVLIQNPLAVVALLVVLAVVNVVFQILGNAVVGALGSFALLGLLVSILIAALDLVFIWITVARAYDQLDATST